MMTTLMESYLRDCNVVNYHGDLFERWQKALEEEYRVLCRFHSDYPVSILVAVAGMMVHLQDIITMALNDPGWKEELPSKEEQLFAFMELLGSCREATIKWLSQQEDHGGNYLDSFNALLGECIPPKTKRATQNKDS